VTARRLSCEGRELGARWKEMRKGYKNVCFPEPKKEPKFVHLGNRHQYHFAYSASVMSHTHFIKILLLLLAISNCLQLYDTGILSRKLSFLAEHNVKDKTIHKTCCVAYFVTFYHSWLRNESLRPTERVKYIQQLIDFCDG
jgi:hypothetical protein